MKKNFIVMILASALASPVAMAASSYGGLSFGGVRVEDTDLAGFDDVNTGNIGIAFGSMSESGFGLELMYSFTAIDDDESDISAETDVVGLFAVYQTPGDIYFKAKAGYAFVSLKFDDFDDNDSGGSSIHDTTDGFSYGLSGGVMVGEGSIELTYYVLPEFDKFEGVSIDSDIEMINLTYFWTF